MQETKPITVIVILSYFHDQPVKDDKGIRPGRYFVSVATNWSRFQRSQVIAHRWCCTRTLKRRGAELSATRTITAVAPPGAATSRDADKSAPRQVSPKVTGQVTGDRL